LASLTPALGDVVAIEQLGGLAETVIVKAAGGGSVLYFVDFRRGDPGRWLIEEI
jgi:hypothetical protein